MSKDENRTGTFVVFQPESDRPITRIYTSYKQAVHVAESMSRKHPGKLFLVMEEVNRFIFTEFR